MRRILVVLASIIILLCAIASSLVPLPVKAGSEAQGQTATVTPTIPPSLPRITTSNANQLTLLAVPEGPDDWVTGISFSPNNILAASQYGGTVFLWDAKTFKALATLKPPTIEQQGSGNVIFNSSGTEIASSNGTDSSVLIWDVEDALSKADPTPRMVLRGFDAPPQSIAFGPDGKILAGIDYDGAVRLWDVSSGTLVASFKTGCYSPGAIAFSPDGMTLALALCDGIRLWNIQTQDSKYLVDKSVASLAFSPDVTLLAFEGNNRDLQLTDVKTGKAVASLTSEDFANISAIAFSWDGSIIAAGSPWNYIVLWDVKTGRKLAVLDTGSISGLAFNSDGSLLAAGHAGSGLAYAVTVWGVR